ncbi:MAG: hypothetical protein RMK91_04130 [Pseudanabaenaceae cyanobacterium SKYGB_i_bin29]|nr:hypothetical protein [Pseudanabaenaceae cyanobacterium SKYG29]MDW8421032.1 hypothetical protein [Pseudanabaenaceae cyanobacterium SKYGB_i_bin29]
MDEVETANKLEEWLAVHGLQVQIVQQDKSIVVVFNRPDSSHLLYDRLTEQTIKLFQSINMSPPQEVVFYSRVLGQEEADWCRTVKIKTKDNLSATQGEEVKVIQTEEQPVINPSEHRSETLEPDTTRQRDVKLSDFCFVRNKTLVKTELPHPAKVVAENVKFFHGLGEKMQLELAPFMEDFFKNPSKVSLISVPAGLGTWFEDMKKLKDEEFRSQAIWLSRYCYDSEKTMAEVDSLFQILAETERQKELERQNPSVSLETGRTPSTAGAKRRVSPSPEVVASHTEISYLESFIVVLGSGILLAALLSTALGTSPSLVLFFVLSIVTLLVVVLAFVQRKQRLTRYATIVLISLFSGMFFILLWQLVVRLKWVVSAIAVILSLSQVRKNPEKYIEVLKQVGVGKFGLVVLGLVGLAVYTGLTASSGNAVSVVKVDAAPIMLDLEIHSDPEAEAKYRRDMERYQRFRDSDSPISAPPPQEPKKIMRYSFIADPPYPGKFKVVGSAELALGGLGNLIGLATAADTKEPQKDSYVIIRPAGVQMSDTILDTSYSLHVINLIPSDDFNALAGICRLAIEAEELDGLVNLGGIHSVKTIPSFLDISTVDIKRVEGKLENLNARFKRHNENSKPIIGTVHKLEIDSKPGKFKVGCANLSSSQFVIQGPSFSVVKKK